MQKKTALYGRFFCNRLLPPLTKPSQRIIRLAPICPKTRHKRSEPERPVVHRYPGVVDLVLDIYRQFGFEDVRTKLSTRPANRMGNDAMWDLLEGALVHALEEMSLDYQVNAGEGAFYGPKLEFAQRRHWPRLAVRHAAG